MADIIQLRRDTAANWTSANPTLAQGELGVETDTDKIKIGDGSTAWTSLGYIIDTGGYASYADTTANFTGTLQNGGSNVVVDSDIGSTVQAYDSNLPTWPSSVSATEVGYLNGVTSAIQTQLNAKVGSTYTGDVDITGEIKADSYNESYVATSTTGAVTVNCESGNTFMCDMTGNVTFTFSNPPASGTAYTMTIEVIQDSTARTVTWPASVDWPSATAPTLSTTSGAVDVFVFTTRNGGTTWYGFTAGQAIA